MYEYNNSLILGGWGLITCIAHITLFTPNTYCVEMRVLHVLRVQLPFLLSSYFLHFSVDYAWYAFDVHYEPHTLLSNKPAGCYDCYACYAFCTRFLAKPFTPVIIHLSVMHAIRVIYVIYVMSLTPYPPINLLLTVMGLIKCLSCIPRIPCTTLWKMMIRWEGADFITCLTQLAESLLE